MFTKQSYFPGIVERRWKVVKINQVANVTRKTLCERPPNPESVAIVTPVMIKVTSITNDKNREER